MQNQEPPAQEHNPYAPPAAVLEGPATQEFYVVATRKFWIMSLATAGLYFIYWGFRHYQTIRAKSMEAMWPVARAIFLIFFLHDLYRRFAAKALARNNNFAFNHVQYATATVAVVLTSYLCSQLSARGIGSPLTDFVPLLLVPAQCYLMAAAQSVANFASGDSEGHSNANFTGLNVLWLAIVALMWSLALLGVYITLYRPDLLQP